MNFCLAVTLPRQRNSDQLILARAPAPDGHCILWIFIIVYTARVIVVLIMRFRRRGCFLGGFSSVNYEISTGTLGQSLLVDCVALLLFQNSRSVRQ